MKKETRTQKQAEAMLDQLPGNYYYRIPRGQGVVAFEKEPCERRYNHWTGLEKNYDRACAIVMEGEPALTHDEAYQELLDCGIKGESILLCALDLSDEYAWDNLDELLSDLNTETGSAWMSVEEGDDEIWAREEETGAFLRLTGTGFEIVEPMK